MGRNLIFRCKAKTSPNPLQYRINKSEAKLYWNSPETLRHADGAFANGKIVHEGVPINLFQLRDPYDGLIDIGAHIGIYSIVFGLLNEGTPVYAYEPDPDNYDLLKQNLKANDIHGEAFQTAVSGSGGNISFFTHSEKSVAHTAFPNNDDQEKFKQITMDSLGINEILTAHELECPFLKIDAEGLELEIIKKLFPYSKTHPVSGFLELHLERLDMEQSTTIEEMREEGFNIYEVKEKMSDTNPGYLFTNFDDQLITKARDLMD